MQEILNYGKSIRQFKNTTNKVVFVQAQHYPSFFERHLVHPSRRIKALLHDPNANIRAFYFQYLMLCFEIQNQNFQTYIQKIHKFLQDPHFQFLFLEEDDQKIFNDKQFKRFILQFMQMLDSGQYESTQAAIMAYPIADIVFVYFFRSLAIYAQITKDFDSYVDKSILFGFLLQNFNIDAQMYEEKCIKFIEAEVFVYEESPQQIYLVYKQIQNSLSESNHQKNHKSLHKKSQDLDMDVDMMQGQVDSMVSSKKQIQQNISMLQYEQGGGTPIMQQYLQSKIQQKISANNNNNIMNQSINSMNSKNNNIGNISGNNAVTVADGGFKKNKIADRQDAYKKITHQFQIKSSVLSCNDEPFVENSAIQYSYRQIILGNQPEQPKQQESNINSNSLINNQSYSWYQKPITHTPPAYQQIQANTDSYHNNNSINTQIYTKFQLSSFTQQTYKQPSLLNSHKKIGTNQQYYPIDTADNKQYSRSNSNSLSNKYISNSYLSNNASIIKPKQYQPYQLLYKGNDQQRQTKYEYNNQNKGVGYGNYSIYANNVTYNNINNGKNSYDGYGNNQVTENRNKTSYSYQQTITKPAQQPYRQHSNITFNSNQLLSRLNNLNVKINQNLSHKQTTSNKQILPPVPSKHNITFSSYQSNNYKSDYKTHNYDYSVLQPTLATHIPATRDVPTHEIRADGKASGITGLTVKSQSRQSLNPANNLKNAANTQKYVSQSKTSFHAEASQKQNQFQIIKKNTNPQYKKSPLYNPVLSKQSYTSQYTNIGQSSKQLTNRDLRQQSLTTKQKLREMIKTKLSVSKQFTNSLTLMKMGEPYNQNIKKIKTRSRDFRQSILNSIK